MVASGVREDRLWFKAKSFGWGWYPVTREGWIVTVAAIGVYIFAFLRGLDLVTAGDAPASWPWFVLAAGSLITLFVVCYRTGERPRWRWGTG